MLHKKVKQNQNIEFKEEQRDFLCSNKGSDRCSSLDINMIDTSIDRLAEILVEVYIESKKRESRENHN